MRILISFIAISLTFACQVSKTDKGVGSDISFQNLFDAEQNEDVSCYRIPAIVTAPNGDLVVAIDERVPNCRDLKWSKEINIVIRRSSDNGETWSPIERIADYPYGQSASDPSMVVDQVTGEIFLFFNFMDLDKEKDIYYLKVMKSGDNGKTWTKPRDITAQISKPEWHRDFKFITSGRGVQTSDGKLLHTMVNLDHGLRLFQSDDHGETWKLIDTPIEPGNESKVIELADGRWMVNSRVNNSGMRYSHISSDNGKSWTSKREETLTDPGCNGSILRYSQFHGDPNEDILLLSNANSNKRENLVIRISYDGGKSWSKGKTIYPGGSAYSTMTVLENGSIGLVFEKDGYKENVFVKFPLEWVTETGN